MTTSDDHLHHYTLLTGATGLVGRYLLKDLLVAGIRVAVLVRDSKKVKATQRVEDICRFWEAELGRKLPRPVCITGDCRSPKMGLTPADEKWVTENCNSLFHNAAVLSFYRAPRDQEPWLTNLDGTINVVQCAADLGIDHLHYVSTAYVCGDRQGVVSESDLDEDQGFRNDYEQSKFLAEKFVHQFDGFKTTTIYRPAVITADSQTGYTNTYHGLHLYLRLMSLLVPQVEPDENGLRQTNIRLPMKGTEKRNVVTVDWVSQVMTAIFLNQAAHGHTFHISPVAKLTPRSVIDACCEYYSSTGVEYAGYENVAEDKSSHFEREFLNNVGIYTSYDGTDPSFDTTNLRKFAGHISCPDIDAEAIHQFIRFGEKDKWGKRRERSEVPEFMIADHASSLRSYGAALKENFLNQSDRTAESIGFDVIGPGGGQWHFDFESESVQRGLPTDPSAPVIRVPVATVAAMLVTENESPLHSNQSAQALFENNVKTLTEFVSAEPSL